MKRKILYILLLCTLQGQAQSLQELINQIPNQNLSLKVLEKEYQASLEKANQITPRPDPELGIGIFPLPVETRLGGQALRVSAMQQFPWFGSIDQKKGVEVAKSKVKQGKIEIQQWELALSLIHI